jgi:hypothetical protein
LNGPRVRNPIGARDFFSKTSRPAPAPSQPPFSGYRPYFPALKRQRRGFNH